MPELLKAPVTPAQQARDALLGALVGLARATTNEPKTDDTDEVLNAGLRLAAQPDAPEERLQRMLAIVQTEKHRVAPGCATCAMPCGNTNDYDFVRLWAAPESIRTLKLQMLSAGFVAGAFPAQTRKVRLFCVFLWQFRNTVASKCIPVSFTPDFLPFSESFLQKRLYKPFLKTYYISNIFHGANAAQPPVQHPNTIKEGFIYARKEKDRSGCSCCGSSCR